MFYNVAFVVVLSFGPAFLVSEGVSFPDAGFDVSLLSWALLFSLPLGGFILAQVERPTHILVLCFAGVAALIAAVTAGIAPAFALAAAGVLAGIPGGPLMKLPSEFLAGKNRSAGMGAFYTCYYLGMFALVPVAGIIRDVSARPAAPLLFAVGCALAAAATLVGFRVAMRGRVP
jgi:MFS family permease